jgi:hypothetical protein
VSSAGIAIASRTGAAEETGSEKEGPVMWRREGCCFRLDLPEGVAKPMWHTLDRPMGTPPDEIPDCPNINWIKLGEHFEKRQRPRVQPPLRQSDEGGGALSTEQ